MTYERDLVTPRISWQHWSYILLAWGSSAFFAYMTLTQLGIGTKTPSTASEWFMTTCYWGLGSGYVFFAWEGASKKRGLLRQAGQYSFWVFPLERLAAWAWWSLNLTFAILVAAALTRWLTA